MHSSKIGKKLYALFKVASNCLHQATDTATWSKSFQAKCNELIRDKKDPTDPMYNPFINDIVCPEEGVLPFNEHTSPDVSIKVICDFSNYKNQIEIPGNRDRGAAEGGSSVEPPSSQLPFLEHVKECQENDDDIKKVRKSYTKPRPSPKF